MPGFKTVQIAFLSLLIMSATTGSIAQEFSAPISFHKSQILTSAEVIQAIQNDNYRRSVGSIDGMVGYVHLQTTTYSLVRDARELEVLLKLYDLARLVPDAKNSDSVNRTLTEQIEHMQRAIKISIKNIENAIAFVRLPEATAALLIARDRIIENQRFINSLSPTK